LVGRPILLVGIGQEHEQLFDFLKQKGHEIVTAQSASQAFSVIRNLSPVAIVLDLLTLGPETWRILQDLRANEDTAQIPVLALTGAEDQSTAASLGASAALVKPFDPALLLRILEEKVLRSPGEPSRILVVDSEAPARELIDETLRSAGLLPVLASSGKHALEVLARSPISAVVVDLLLPEMSGFDLILRVRQNPSFAKIPIVVLTAKQIDQEDAQILSRQTNTVFFKAFPWRERFLAKVHELLEHVIKRDGAKA